MMIYSLDANVFIEAARRYYAMDIVPGFWEWLDRTAMEEKICSIDRVDAELMDNNLRTWVDGGGFANGFASSDSPEVVSAYGDIMAWVYHQDQFTDSAKTEFASGADGWLIAYSKVKQLTVVTQEVLRPDIRRRVPNPNVCQAFTVPYVDTFAMLRALGFSL